MWNAEMAHVAATIEFADLVVFDTCAKYRITTSGEDGSDGWRFPRHHVEKRLNAAVYFFQVLAALDPYIKL